MFDIMSRRSGAVRSDDPAPAPCCPCRIPFTVTIADPGADLDGYEEIVEVGFVSSTGKVLLIGWRMSGTTRRCAAFPCYPPGWAFTGHGSWQGGVCNMRVMIKSLKMLHCR